MTRREQREGGREEREEREGEGERRERYRSTCMYACTVMFIIS